VFRITKNIHNILQGVSHPDQRISAEEKQAIIDWITENANRYWFSEGGPLCPPEDGGADVVIVSAPESTLQIHLPTHEGFRNRTCYCVDTWAACTRLLTKTDR